MSLTSTQDLTLEQIQSRIASLCKPPGSLGVIEQVAEQLCRTQGTLRPQTRPRSTTVFAADHGVTVEGVSAWPSSVTAAVVRQMRAARTASGVFASALGCEYEVVDVGLLEPLEPSDPTFLDCAKRRGSANLLREAAMSESDFQHAWNVGVNRATDAVARGHRLLIGGEMGIGNTTSATCLIALLCDVSTETELRAMVGPGAGADASQMERKVDVIWNATQRVRALGLTDPRETGRQAGGLEIAALAGYYATGASQRCTILVDGVIASAAALLADAVQPNVGKQMIAGHKSTELAQQVALQRLGLTPILDLQMRLGEATGALAALPIIDLAAAMMSGMATLDDLQ